MTLQPTLKPCEILTYTTADGWRAPIRRYRGTGPPVLLVHGMGANHYNWDFREEVSLAHHLHQQGWDVYVPVLRGDPGSEHADVGAEGRFDFDDHAEFDMPAIVAEVLKTARAEQLYWVGHSMGGMLLYTALAEYPERIAAGVAICSPSGFEHPNFQHRALGAIGWLLGGEGLFRRGPLMKWGLMLGKNSPVVRRISNPENLDMEMAYGIVEHALVDLSWPMAKQAALWVNQRAVTRRDGTPWLRSSDVPMLVMGAPLDLVAPEPDVRATAERFTNVQ